MDENQSGEGKPMKKRGRIVLTALCLLLTLAGRAETGAPETYDAVIASSCVTDRIAVRTGPDAEADSPVLLYCGVPVRVLEEQGDWACVEAGGDGAVIRGYVPKDHLMRKNRNYGAPECLISAEAVSDRVVLRTEPREDAPQLRSWVDGVDVLGEAGEWRLVSSAGKTGYVRSNQLTNRHARIETAFVCPADDGSRAKVFADRELTVETGWLYAGALLTVKDFSPDGWAEAECLGVPDNAGDENNISGFLRVEDVQVFRQIWQVRCQTPTAYAAREIHLDAPQALSIPQGAALLVVGETADQYQAVYGLVNPAFTWRVDKDLVRLSDLPGKINGCGRIGFAYLPAVQDEQGYALGTKTYDASDGESLEDPCLENTAELLADLGEFLQLRVFGTSGFFVKTEGVRTVLEKDLIPLRSEDRIAGTWTAQKEDEGLWSFWIPAGEKVELTLSGSAGTQNYAADMPGEDVQYAVYIREGEQVTLSGDGWLTPFRQGEYPVLLPQDDPGDPLETEPVFAGTGRYFCTWQLANHDNWFDFRLEPLPGAQKPWAKITHLLSQGEEESVDYAVDGTVWLSVRPGEFLELHDCILFVNYGNG